MRNTAGLCVALLVLGGSLAHGQPNANPPRSVFDIDMDRSAIHRQSGLVCPTQVTGWQRVATVVYDQVGLDVSCGYRSPAGLITLYMTKVDQALSLKAMFEEGRQALQQGLPQAMPDDRSADAPAPFEWLRAGFTLQGGENHSDLLLADLSGWHFKYRVTYRSSEIAAVNAALAELTMQVSRTAAPRLAACAASPVPSRPGKHVLSVPGEKIVVAATGLLIFPVLSSTTSTSPIWCVEGGFGARDALYLYWRNVGQGVSLTERITPVADGPAIFISQLGLKLNPATGDMDYIAWVDGADEMRISAFFEGRPALDKLPVQLLDASPPAYATVGKRDNKITISLPK